MSPSPQIGWHKDFVVLFPPMQIQPFQYPWQDSLQPFSSWVASSHVSFPTRRPSSQISWQVVPVVPVQFQPGSLGIQLMLQPMPSSEPSSHISVPTKMPSPQISEQMDLLDGFGFVQVQPILGPRQFGRQPQFRTVWLSSQVSSPTRIPSLQISEQMEGEN